MTGKPPILTRDFAVLSGVTLCFFIAFGIILPTLPIYSAQRGADPSEIGLIIGIFSLSAIFLRPFLGREVDRRSRRGITSLGVGLNAFACFLYPFATSVAALMVVRLIHGAGIASFYPGASTLTADITPDSRRAEAISYFSMFLYGGNAIGPVVGDYLTNHAGFRAAFWGAAAVALIGLLLSLALREPERPPRVVGKRPLLSRPVMFPASVLMLASVAWASLGFIPLFVQSVPGVTSGVFFLSLSITVLIVRPLVGRLADRVNRAAVILPGLLIVILAMLVVSAGPRTPILVSAAILFGIGWGALYPALFTLSIDRVPQNQRGTATGTFTAAFDLSFGLSSALLGVILEYSSFSVLFLVAAGFSAAAAVLFAGGRSRSEEVHPALEIS